MKGKVAEELKWVGKDQRKCTGKMCGGNIGAWKGSIVMCGVWEQDNRVVMKKRINENSINLISGQQG